MKFKYIWLFTLSIVFLSCDETESPIPEQEVSPELISGSVDFSNYVALGASFTAGFTDGALFKAGQENSFPNILSQQFSKVGGSNLKQPLTNDNFGGLAAGENRLQGFNPRLVFGGATPVSLESVIGPVTVTTDIISNNPTGPFQNLGVPGAKSFHLLFDGYGNPANLATQTANPYFVRMASSPSATMLGDAMAQNPTFFTLSEIGGNDVLGYATSGGNGSNNITPVDGPPGVGFNATFSALISTLTSNGAKGAVTNVPYITDLPHFTTVPFKPLSPLNPAFGPQIPTLNGIFGLLNQVFVGIGVPERSIVFSQTAASAVVIDDENLDNKSNEIAFALKNSNAFTAFVQSFGLPAAAAPIVADLFGTVYGQARQANENDLLVLPSSSIIGTPNTESITFLMSRGLSQQVAGQFSAEGITLPLADKWVLLPSEQDEIRIATDAYNATIASVVNANDNVALVDLNAVLTEMATTGINFDGFNLSANLVTGGAVSLDGIHLNARGYAFMANKFLEAIDTSFGTNFIASGNVAKAIDYPTNYSPLLQ